MQCTGTYNGDPARHQPTVSEFAEADEYRSSENCNWCMKEEGGNKIDTKIPQSNATHLGGWMAAPPSVGYASSTAAAKISGKVA